VTDQELLDTIERIRTQVFSEIPAELVRDIVLIEQDYTENRTEAYKRVMAAVDAYLDRPTVSRSPGAVT
jgi:hypothetical protein